MNPTLKGNSALQRFEHGSTIETHNRIMFDFFLGLPHMYVVRPTLLEVTTSTSEQYSSI